MPPRQALGDRPQYHIYLEEVDTLPEVWARRRAVPGELPAKEAGQLLLTGRAYAQLPNEVFLVFLKIDRRVSEGGGGILPQAEALANNKKNSGQVLAAHTTQTTNSNAP